MLKIGLTGGMGSGKTTVAGIFGVLGVPVFAADERAKALMDKDPAVRSALIVRFGEGIYAAGRLDRNALAKIIFNDADALNAVNAIVHPAVRANFQQWAGDQQAPYVIMEAAIMAENEGWKQFDQVITVACPEQERVRRVMERDGLTEQQVRARLRNQASEEERQRIAHHAIRNDGQELIIPQVLAIHERIMQSVSA
ncbi:MAG: dephospho-CoA kinase [Flavobacteriales bacterium]|nr:dephospho-CoA kinase [Flavobacteriales bacterium]